VTCEESGDAIESKVKRCCARSYKLNIRAVEIISDLNVYNYGEKIQNDGILGAHVSQNPYQAEHERECGACRVVVSPERADVGDSRERQVEDFSEARVR
jgi:hypothetical protein